MVRSPIRRARSLILSYEGESLVALNFVTKTSCVVGPGSLPLLAALDDWQAVPDLMTPFDSVGNHGLLVEIERLADAFVLVERGSMEGAQDERFETEFKWGATAGLYHFGIRNTEYMSPGQFTGWMTDHVVSTPTVTLFASPPAVGAIRLPSQAEPLPILSVMGRRRSFRGFTDDPIPLAQLADCLFAGLGITGFIEGSFDEGLLPLSMTPSGGGRNPYEAYVYVRNVETLEPGVYHYSAVDHSLSRTEAAGRPKPGAVLAGQPWFDNAAALVLLVANFERTMWKYPHPTGYRVVVLEAGHIAQNILLAATAHGLAAAPTCALSDAESEALTGCTSITQTTLYSVALGVKAKAPTSVDPIHVIPNLAAPIPRGR